MTETRFYEPARLSTPSKPLFSLKALDTTTWLRSLLSKSSLYLWRIRPGMLTTLRASTSPNLYEQQYEFVYVPRSVKSKTVRWGLRLFVLIRETLLFNQQQGDVYHVYFGCSCCLSSYFCLNRCIILWYWWLKIWLYWKKESQKSIVIDSKWLLFFCLYGSQYNKKNATHPLSFYISVMTHPYDIKK